MIDVDITFEDQPWERLLQHIEAHSVLSAGQLLTCLEDASEDQTEQVLAELFERDVTLDIGDLPKLPVSDAAAQRLRFEEKLVLQTDMIRELPENDPLRLYLEELAATPTVGDPAVLALTPDAPGVREQLVTAMLGRAVAAAREYVGNGVLLLDLIQEASLGLWQGISTYTDGDIYDHCDRQIHWQLRTAVLLQARNAGLGQKLRRSMEDYRSVDERLLTELGRNPMPEEMAEALHMSLPQTQMLASMIAGVRQLNRVRTPEPEEIPQEEDQAVEDTAYFQMRQRIQELMSGLSPEDAKLLTLRYGLEGGLPLEPEQVAQRLGLTAKEVVNREAAALAKLRQ